MTNSRAPGYSLKTSDSGDLGERHQRGYTMQKKKKKSHIESIALGTSRSWFLLLLAVRFGIESSSTSTFNKDSHYLNRESVMITRGHCVSS